MTQYPDNNENTPADNEEAISPFVDVDQTIKGSDDEIAKTKTSQKKEYGDTQLNKGLESQAMDTEGTNL